MKKTTDSKMTTAARQIVASSLALALADPQSRRRIEPVPADALTYLHRAWRIAAQACRARDAQELSLGELPPGRSDVGALVGWLSLLPNDRAAVMQRVFGLVISRICPPYETEYCHWKDPTYRANQLADVAGFFRAFGFQPDPTQPERHDHVTLELEFLAILHDRVRRAANKEQRGIARGAMIQFVRDHLAWWLPTFAKCLERRIDQVLSPTLSADERRHLETFRGVALFIRAWSAVERTACGVNPCRQIIAPQVPTAEPVTEICQSTCNECV